MTVEPSALRENFLALLLLFATPFQHNLGLKKPLAFALQLAVAPEVFLCLKPLRGLHLFDPRVQVTHFFFQPNVVLRVAQLKSQHNGGE